MSPLVTLEQRIEQVQADAAQIHQECRQYTEEIQQRRESSLRDRARVTSMLEEARLQREWLAVLPKVPSTR